MLHFHGYLNQQEHITWEKSKQVVWEIHWNRLSVISLLFYLFCLYFKPHISTACLNKFWVVAATSSAQEKNFSSLLLGEEIKTKTNPSVLFLKSIGAICKDRMCHCTLRSSRIRPWVSLQRNFVALVVIVLWHCWTWHFSWTEIKE